MEKWLAGAVFVQNGFVLGIIVAAILLFLLLLYLVASSGNEADWLSRNLAARGKDIDWYKREVNALNAEIDWFKREVNALDKEIYRLKYRNWELGNGAKPKVPTQQNGLPTSPQAIQTTSDNRGYYPQGPKNMYKGNAKSVVREVGLVRLLMMFGLSAALANMIISSWERIKHHFNGSET